MKKAILFFFTATPVIFMAQTVLSSQGGMGINASGSVSYTLGEVVTSTGITGSYSASQGFQQGSWNFVSLEILQPLADIRVFPNPVNDYLIIQTSSTKLLNYTFFDESGRLILEGFVTNENFQLETSSLKPGAYYLYLNVEKEILQVYHLIKNQ